MGTHVGNDILDDIERKLKIIQMKIKLKQNILMQSASLQFLDISTRPLQSAAPSPFGSGLLHNRFRICVPVPHDLEHSDQADHSPNPPFPV